MSAPQRVAPTRTAFAQFPSNVQRTSDSSSAASGCDSPLALQRLNPNTLVPPGDEHTDALLQSLMSMPSKPMAPQQGPSGGVSGSSGLASGPSGLRPASQVGGQPGALELLLAQPHGGVPLGSAGDDPRGQALGSFYREDDVVGPPRSLPPYDASAATVPVTMPYGSTMMLARHAAATASAIPTITGIKSAPNPGSAMRFQLEPQAAMLLPPTALNRSAMQPDIPLGLLQSDLPLTGSPTAAEADAAFRCQEAMFSGRQNGQLLRELQALEAHRVQPAAPIAPRIQQQQQQGYERQRQRPIHEACANIAVSASGATTAYREQQPGPLPPLAPQQQQQQQQRSIALGGMPTGDARADQPIVRRVATDVIGPRASSDEAAAAAAEDLDGSVAGSARQRRRIDIGQVTAGAATSEKVVSIVGQITIKKDALSGEAGAGSAPTGSIGRLSSGDVNTQTAPDRGKPGPLCVRSSSEVDDGQGGRDCEDGNEDYTTDDGSGGNLNRSSRKRTASQRRRGSSAMRKELSRERNRTAQRRFRERQRDLIRALQDQVERQDALIQDLRIRLAVYEDKPPYSEEGIGGDEPGSTSKTKTTGG
ncbi:hypothetical protein Vafri_21585 [Volvox africanus]|nr:hypothetical protein Vafri_21585 [Volvox africanus]